MNLRSNEFLFCSDFFFLVVCSVLCCGDRFRKLDEYLGLFSMLSLSHANSSPAKIVKQISEEDYLWIHFATGRDLDVNHAFGIHFLVWV